MTKVIQKEMFYVPAEHVSEEHLAKYEREVFDESSCSRCPVNVEDDEQGSYLCDGCPSNYGNVKLHTFLKRKKQSYVGFPSGNVKKFMRVFPRAEIVEKRCTKKMRHKITFTGKLLPHQKKCIAQFLSRGRGILEAPPRSGKTVMMVYLICKYGYKALILAHQDDLLTQFINTLIKFTDMEDVAKYHGIRIAGLAKTPEQLADFDICLSTYQSFIREGSGEAKVTKYIQGEFGFVAVDECHRVAAACFSSVVNKMDSRIRFGVTGTVERKDGLEFITTDILGPVTARAKVKSLKPTVEITTTDIKFKDLKTWVGFINNLSSNKKRNKLICDIAIAAMKKGHSVIIPCARKQHIIDLVEEINTRCKRPIAAEFHASVNKEEVLNAARERKVRCVVAIRQMVQEGIDVPCWSYMVECVPISNPPKFYQESMRICTPMKGKKTPTIHFIVDMQSPQSTGCFRTTLFKSVFPLKFILSERVKAECLAATGRGNSSSGTAKKKSLSKKEGIFRQF